MKQSQKLRQYRIDQSRLASNKRKRKVETYQKIAEYFKKLNADRKLGNEYKTSIAMEAVEDAGPASSTTTATATVRPQCPHCGVFGHKMRNSSKCLYYVGKALNAVEINDDGTSLSEHNENNIHEDEDVDTLCDKQERMAMEIDLLDTLPCVTRNCHALEIALESQD